MKENKTVMQEFVVDFLAKNKPETDTKEWRDAVAYMLTWDVKAGIFTEEEAIELAIIYTTW